MAHLLNNNIFASIRTPWARLPEDDAKDEKAGGKSLESAEVPNTFEAILANRVDMLDKLLDTRVQEYIVRMKSRDCLERTPLYYACYIGSLEIANKLIKTAAVDIDAPEFTGKTPLYIASYCGHKEIVECLLSVDANVNVKERIFGWTPMFGAVWSGHVEVVEMLIEAKSSLMHRDKNGRSSLFLAAQQCKVELIDLLLSKRGTLLDDVDDFGRTSLYIATQIGCLGSVKRLLHHGANTEIADKDGRKPLYVARKLGFDAVTKALIEANADALKVTIDRFQANGLETEPCRGEFITFLGMPLRVKVDSMCEENSRIWGGCSDGTLIVWDKHTLSQLACYPNAQSGLIHSMVCSNEDRVWSLSSNLEIYVWCWDEKAGSSEGDCAIKLVENFSQGSQEILCLCRYEDMVISGSYNSIFVWESRSAFICREVRLNAAADIDDPRLKDYDIVVSKILCHGSCLYCVIKNYIVCYEMTSPDELKCVGVFSGHDNLVTDLAIVDDCLWTSSRDNSIRVWDVKTSECIMKFGDAGAGEVSSLCRTRDRQILSGEEDGHIRSWDTKDLIWKRTFPHRHENRLVSCMHWCDDSSTLWVGCLDKQVSCWR
ncbi:ankyrin repeat and death domain-containing protein 1B-like [Schistocerca gregaria]|uniref:ankyrin repeat and death domain-containing protein 1B-like n=1 Tax=Schistocerca gregaria TaxID=7010 RepID=UPI00211DB540|nr:ankyrin repeat and death domain-containing protein 1B-like [Schistocerca gregaria]